MYEVKYCSQKGCQREASPKAAKGLCHAHYKRLLRGKDMDTPIKSYGDGWVSSHGYRYIGKTAEHRLTMGRILGRELRYNEVVHHKDENPLNNDPSNLMIMDRGEHVRLHCEGMTNEERKEHKRGLSGAPNE